jgi:trypsin
VNADYIVTAAHCATLAASRYFIVAGEHDLYQRDETEQTVQVESITQHPQYSSLTSRNDIALFKVTPPLVLNEVVQAANLAPEGFETRTGVLRAVGWGALTEGGDVPDKLQEVVVPFVTDVVCLLEYGIWDIYIYASMICAGASGKDSCGGDSGGPLEHVATVDNTTVTTLVGLTSFGIGCARPRFPGVYSEVSYFRDFISETIGTKFSPN